MELTVHVEGKVEASSWRDSEGAVCAMKAALNLLDCVWAQTWWFSTYSQFTRMVAVLCGGNRSICRS